jgi:hypothetical protein
VQDEAEPDDSWTDEVVHDRWKQRRPDRPLTQRHSDNADELNKLAELRDRGVLTLSEFEAAKAKILGPPKRRRRMAERSDFTAVLALLSAIVFWPAGIILGHQARREASQTGGGGLALAALIIGYVAGAVTIVVIILAI